MAVQSADTQPTLSGVRRAYLLSLTNLLPQYPEKMDWKRELLHLCECVHVFGVEGRRGREEGREMEWVSYATYYVGIGRSKPERFV